jgi:hypothetical protein
MVFGCVAREGDHVFTMTGSRDRQRPNLIQAGVARKEGGSHRIDVDVALNQPEKVVADTDTLIIHTCMLHTVG